MKNMKRFFWKISVLAIVLIFLWTSLEFAVAQNNHIPVSNSSPKRIIMPLTQENNSGAGYVKYTLVLFNNTLINGNYVNTSNGYRPVEVAFDSSNGYVYVTNHLSNNVSVINGATNTVIQTIPVGSGPYGVAFDSSNGYVYVANCLSNNVSVINGATNTVIQTIPVGSGPEGVAFDSSNGYVYVTNDGLNTVSVINGATNTVIQTIPVGFWPAGV
ncbi:MAG: YncE family protein, partial [Candidatus Micrarchaeia archaeon]